MNSNKSLMLKALTINLSLYSLIYALSYSFLNLLNVVPAEYLALNSVSLLVLCVAGRDACQLFKNHFNYLACFAGFAASAYLFSGFMPSSVDTVSLVGLIVSPMVLVSLFIRTFDAQREVESNA